MSKLTIKSLSLKLLNRLRRYRKELFYRKNDLIIFDDVFPHPLSPFRLTEFNIYLSHFSKLRFYSTASSFPALKEEKSFEQIVKAYGIKHGPSHKKIVFFDYKRPLNSRLVYVVFLQNIIQILPILEKNKIPFVFTLYPGGGFVLNDQKCDKNLNKVFQSELFKHVIVTQKITYDYLIEKGMCQSDKITFIFGLVMPTQFFSSSNSIKVFFPGEKDHFDICFVAHKYMSQGKDKGYDLFIETGKRLCKRHKNIFLHIIGPWSGEDYDLTGIEDNVHFYGSLTSESFPEFYGSMDIILSPNRPFTLFPGAFDGFPTGSVTEASLNGVAMFVTDSLKMNVSFRENEEIVIVKDETQDIFEKIEFYYKHPEQLYSLAEKGKQKSWELYNIDTQMNPRIKLLKSTLKEVRKQPQIKRIITN